MSGISPYYEKYPGYWGMKWHDDDDALKRWFDDYKIDRHESFADATEWLTIAEYSWACRGKTITRYEGTIGADHHDRTRAVRFETGAPPPPTFLLPVRRKHEPRPPEPRWVTERRHADQLRWEMDMRAAFARHFTPQQRFIAQVLPPIDPPPPRYRRN